MATPTESEVRTQIDNAIKLFDENDAHLRENSGTNVGALIDTLVASVESDYASDILAGIGQMRGTASSLVSPQVARSIMDPLLLTYAKVLDFPETSPDQIAQRLYVDFAERGTPVTVKERNFTFATPSAGGSNVGGGTLHRLNLDAYGHDIENQNPEAKKARCVADHHSRANEHQEIFELRASDTPRDDVAGFLANPQRVGQITALSADASMVANPTFSTDAAAASPTAITSWTVSSGAIGDFEIVEGSANTYRTAQLEGNGTTTESPKSLKIKASAGVEQNFAVNSIELTPAVPYFAQVAVNPTVGSAVGGTVTFTVGGVSKAVTIAAMSSGWNIISIDLGANNWYRTINAADPKVDVSWSTATSGYVLVDDVIIAPMTQFGGGWYALVGNATSFQVDDEFTWTDTAVGSKTQEWFARLYNVYLPSDATPVWADPS